jgi:hypothetical protein
MIGNAAKITLAFFEAALGSTPRRSQIEAAKSAFCNSLGRLCFNFASSRLHMKPFLPLGGINTKHLPAILGSPHKEASMTEVIIMTVIAGPILADLSLRIWTLTR